MKKDFSPTHPVYLHARSLADLSVAFAQYVEYSYEHLSGNGMAPLQWEIAEAIKTDSRLIHTNAAAMTRERSLKRTWRKLNFLRILSRNLLSYCNGLEQHGLKEREYVRLIRKEIRLYRRALRQWAVSLN